MVFFFQLLLLKLSSIFFYKIVHSKSPCWWTHFTQTVDLKSSATLSLKVEYRRGRPYTTIRRMGRLLHTHPPGDNASASFLFSSISFLYLARLAGSKRSSAFSPFLFFSFFAFFAAFSFALTAFLRSLLGSEYPKTWDKGLLYEYIGRLYIGTSAW